MRSLRNVAALITALVIAAVLARFVRQDHRIAAIRVSQEARRRDPPAAAERVLVRNMLATVRPDGVLYFDFVADVRYATDDTLTLEIRASEDSEFRVQRRGFAVSGGVVSGVAQLGSDHWPVGDGKSYSFRLRDRQGTVLLDGDIYAQVFTIQGPQDELVAWIGLAASLVEVLLAAWAGIDELRRRSSPPSRRRTARPDKEPPLHPGGTHAPPIARDDHRSPAHPEPHRPDGRPAATDAVV
jgi:hypothetical protein